MTAKLIVSDGRTEHELLLVGNLVVGRDPVCDISGDDVLLSRRHAEFIVGGNGIRVKDLGSRNGVYVNGKKVAEAKLASGDVLGIGHFQIRFVEDAASLSSVLAATSPVPHPVTAPPASPAVPAPDATTPVPQADDDDLTKFVSPPGSKPQAAPPTPVRTPAPPTPKPAPVPAHTGSDDDETRFVPAPSARPAPAAPKAAPASMHAHDDEYTRVVSPPSASGSTPKAAPVEPPRPPAAPAAPAAPTPVAPVENDDDYDKTRFVAGPTRTPSPSATPRSPMPPPVAAAPSPVTSRKDVAPPAPPPVAATPPPAVHLPSTPAHIVSIPVPAHKETNVPATPAVAAVSSGAVYGHVVILALAVAGAVAAAFMSGGADAADGTRLIWFVGAAVVSLAATVAVGASLSRRIASTSTAAHASDRARHNG